MAESKVNRENYINIQGWMIVDLHLKGNELLIYACIYGFSQAESQVFSGSLQYLADWTNSTKQGVIKCLKSLVEKGFLTKTEKNINGVKFCEYYATKFNAGVQQSLTSGVQQSLPNNTDSNNLSHNQDKESKRNTFDAIISAYTSDQKTVELLQEWLKVRKAKRAAMTDRAIQMNIDKLDALASQSHMSVCEYLSEVICRGWAAFYPIQQYGKTSGKSSGIAVKQNASDDLDGIF